MEPDRWQRVNAIFEQALEREGDERRAFVKDACEGDADLLFEVEVLLKAHVQAGSFLSGPRDGAPATDRSRTPALTPGVRLGPYEVTAKIGEGGMGEVYRARDTKLDRDVALKVLPSAFTDDPERLARFEREAKVMASLSHPNIGSIHGLEEAGGLRALVLELVDGPTLADRIAEGPIPIDEALPIARQIAEALETAHDQGIVHRDLKPANIKLRPDGTVKVLDFGLAKATAESGTDPSESPTITAAGTAVGVLLGTAAYMSPEQAKGRPAGKPADVWAFGCVFYEMLTAHRAFPGDSVSETLVSVLTRSLDLDLLPSTSPAGTRCFLERCLQREQSQRMRSVVDGLRDLAVAPTMDAGAIKSPSGVSPSLALRWAVGLGVAVVLGAGAVALWTQRSVPVATVSDVLALTLPDGVTFPPIDRVVAVLSPNGREVVYVGQQDGHTQLYRRPMDRPTASPIPGTEGGRYPFFSPDGSQVGFIVNSIDDTVIMRIPVAGGTASTVASMRVDGSEQGAFLNLPDWTENNLIWFGGITYGLYSVPAAGGVPELETRPSETRQELGHFAPRVLPNGRAVLYTAWRGFGNDQHVMLYDRETREHHVLAVGRRPWYSQRGYVVYGVPDGADDDLWVLPFDMGRLATTGPPVPMEEDVQSTFLGSDGTLMYVSGGRPAQTRSLVWVDREGTETLLDIPAAFYMEPRLSPTSDRVAIVNTQQSNRDLWVLDLSRGTQTRLTDHPDEDRLPLWTPDGERVVFLRGGANSVNSRTTLHWVLADGTGGEEQLLAHDAVSVPVSWSGDGRTLVLSDLFQGRGRDLGTLAIDDERGWEPLLRTAYDETAATVSPDGAWIAYESTDSGQTEVYVRPFPDVQRDRWQVSTGGGGDPTWSPDGDELYFRHSPDCDAANLGGCEKFMMTVSVDAQDTFSSGLPVELFEDAYVADASRQYDVDQDGRFLMLKDVTDLPREIAVVRHWDARLGGVASSVP